MDLRLDHARHHDAAWVVRILTTGPLHENDKIRQQWLSELESTTEVSQVVVNFECTTTALPDDDASTLTVNGNTLSSFPSRPTHRLGDSGIQTRCQVILELDHYEGSETPYGRILHSRDGTLLERVFGNAALLSAALNPTNALDDRIVRLVLSQASAVLIFEHTVKANVALEQLSFSKTVVCRFDGSWSRLDVQNATELRQFIGQRVILRRGMVMQQLVLSTIPLISAPEQLCYYSLFRNEFEATYGQGVFRESFCAP